MSDHQNMALVHRFMRTSRQVTHKVHDKLDAIGLYRGQPPLLFALWEKDGLSRKALCGILGVQPATVTKMVKRLTQSGYVTSLSDERDSRVSRVYLTTMGKAIEPEVRGIFRDLNEEIFACLEEEELVQLEHILSKLADATGGSHHG